MLDNVGLRYPHRASGAKAPRTLRPLPLLRFAVSATGGAHLCSIQYYLRFWLSICRTSLAVSALRIMRYCLYKTFHGTSFWEYPPVGAHADVSPYRRTKYQPDVHSNLYGLLVGNTSRTFLPCPPCGYLICRFLLLFLGVGFDTGIPAAKATVLWRRGFCLPGIESAGRFWYTVG